MPGRAFLSRMYSMAPPNLKPHHHVAVKKENKLDLEMWHHFLTFPEIFTRPFLDLCNLVTTIYIDMYSDAAGGFEKGGFGAYCGASWTYGKWCTEFLLECEPSIQYLELFGVTIAVLNWLYLFPNQNLCLHTDNESVMFMINKSSSRCKNCMVLIRLITLECMKCNVRLFANWVATEMNGKADALSRGDLARFRHLGPNLNLTPDPIPSAIWPIEKIWLS